MTIDKALVAHIVGLATTAGSRVSPGFVPESDPLPAVSFFRVSAGRTRTMSGPTGLVSSRFQVNCWAATKDAAVALSESIRAGTDDFSGTMGGVGGAAVQLATIENEGDLTEASPGTEQQSEWGVRFDLMLWYEEAPANP